MKGNDTMKTKQEILKDLFATLTELKEGVDNPSLDTYLKVKLETLYNVLGEDVPEEYWDEIEEILE